MARRRKRGGAADAAETGPGNGGSLLFSPAATPWDLAGAAAAAAAFFVLFLFRSPLWALPGASAGVAAAAAGIAPPPSPFSAPALAAARALAPAAGSFGGGVAVSSALFSALSCGALFLALLSLFHYFVVPRMLADDIRGGAFQAVFVPRLGAAAGVLAWGLGPAVGRLSSGEVPEAVPTFMLFSALALLVHGCASDRVRPLVAGAALAGAAAGVSPVAAMTLPLAAVAVVVAAFETESERRPVAVLACCAAATALGGAVSALAAASAHAAWSAAAGAETHGVLRTLADLAAALWRCTVGSERNLGLDTASARTVVALAVAPFVACLFAARSVLSERENRPAVHLFDAAVLAVSAIAVADGPLSPIATAAGRVPEAAAAALCASSFAFGILAFYLQILYFFEENSFPEPPAWRLALGRALRATLLCACAGVAAAAFGTAVREAPGRASSLWKTIADETLASMDGAKLLRASRETGPLVLLRSGETGAGVGLFPAALPFPGGAGDPALLAAETDPGAWEDAGLAEIPSGLVFRGTAAAPSAADLDAAAERWEKLAAEAAPRVAAARRAGGRTAARAARLLSARLGATGGELARAKARAGDAAAARRLAAAAFSFDPGSPSLALAAAALAEAPEPGALAAMTARGGAGLAGLAEISVRGSRPVSPEAEAFLAPGFMRAGREERALAALSRAEAALPAGEAGKRAVLRSFAGRVRLMLGDRDGARADFEAAATLSGGREPQSAYALEVLFAPPAEDADSEAALDARLQALGATPDARLASRLRAMEARGIPVSARMRLEKAIRDDAADPVLRLMRFERSLDALAAAPEDDRRRWREAAGEDLEKLRENPGRWGVRIALGATRMWLLDGQTGLARAELANAAMARPDDRRLLRPLVALDAALGLADARADHLAALRRADAAAAAEAENAPVPAQDSLLGISLEEETFAKFPEDARAAEYEGAAAVVQGDGEAALAALRAAFASAALSDAVPTP